MMLVLLAAVLLAAAAAKLHVTARASRDRPAVPGGTRRDHFGDRLTASAPTPQSPTTR